MPAVPCPVPVRGTRSENVPRLGRLLTAALSLVEELPCGPDMALLGGEVERGRAARPEAGRVRAGTEKHACSTTHFEKLKIETSRTMENLKFAAKEFPKLRGKSAALQSKGADGPAHGGGVALLGRDVERGHARHALRACENARSVK